MIPTQAPAQGGVERKGIKRKKESINKNTNQNIDKNIAIDIIERDHTVPINKKNNT